MWRLVIGGVHTYPRFQNRTGAVSLTSVLFNTAEDIEWWTKIDEQHYVYQDYPEAGLRLEIVLEGV